MLAYESTKKQTFLVLGDVVVLKRLMATGVVILLLMSVATTSASTAGTELNPVISLSYLNETFAPNLMAEVAIKHNSIAGMLDNRLEGFFRDYMVYDFSPAFSSVSLLEGDSLVLVMGSSFVLLSGSATFSSVSGTVINLSTGNEVSLGSELVQNQRYFCVEDTTASISAAASSIGYVDGRFIINAESNGRMHDVFRDIMLNDWFYSAVEFVYNNGIFQGTSQNTFSPFTSMTRGMFVTVLYRLDGMEPVEPGMRFSDVDDESLYYYSAITWAVDNNIVNGYSNGTFGPDDHVTREQMAAIIFRYADHKENDMAVAGALFDSFADRDDVSEFAINAMRWAVSNGIINGSDGMLLPGSIASRAEVAQIISNYASWAID